MADVTAPDQWAAEEDGDLCRVCRTEAEASKPLIYPCKCSGSVRYVHSDCLQEWLSHSRKRYCEICGHYYTFTKVYPSSIPSAIPVIVYVRQSVFVAGRIAWRMVRVCIAIISWLVILPCITMACLRIIMSGTSSVMYPTLAYGLRHAIANSYHDLNGTFVMPNSTDPEFSNITGRDRVLNAVATNSTLNFFPSFWDRMAADSRNLVAFVFRGQIVAISVATGLIGLILLREWIAQQEWHARPAAPEPEEPLNPADFVFRNGQAISVAEIQRREEEANKAVQADEVAGEVDGDGDGDGGETTDAQPEIELDSWDDIPDILAPDYIIPDDLPPEMVESIKFARAYHLRPLSEWPQEAREARMALAANAAEVFEGYQREREERGETDADFDSDYYDRDAKPERPVLSHGAFEAPEMLGGGSSQPDAWETNAEAGPSSRGAADVPVDVESGHSSPASWARVNGTNAEPSLEQQVDQSNDRRRSSPGRVQEYQHSELHPRELKKPQLSRKHSAVLELHPDGSYASDLPSPDARAPETYPSSRESGSPFEPLATVASGPSDSAEYSPSYRRASDPGPDGSPSQRPNQHAMGSTGRSDLSLPVIVEATSGAGAEPAEPHNAQAGPSRRQASAGPSTPAPIAETPEPNEFESGLLVPPAAVLSRSETEELETDADAEPETDVNPAVIEEVVDIPPDQWRAWAVDDDDDGVVLNAEMVQRAMARNELEGVGMEIPPEDDEDRPLDADDWDGIFEVVGFIGPLTGLMHNHIFVSFAMAFTLAVLVGVPIMIGKLVLSTDFFCATGDMFVATARSVSFVSDCLIVGTRWVLGELLAFPRFITKPAADYVLEAFNMTTSDLSGAFNLSSLASISTSFSPSAQRDALMAMNYTAEDMPVVGSVAHHVLNGLEWLGENAYNAHKAFRLWAISIAASPDANDQLWCLMAGYLTMASSFLGLAILDAANLLQFSQSFMEKARSFLTFLKVVFFMTIEIVFFPVLVGCIMCLCALPLLGNTAQDMLNRIVLRPFGSIFLAWACGTVFMISFAAFLSHMRTITRPGAIYFIRDPSDPSHSPVKEIMDRPALAQFPRLAVSATMYTVVIFSVFGAVPWGISYFPGVKAVRDMLPLRLDQRPISSIPFDVLLLHLVLPPSWDMLYMHHRMRKAFLQWWTWVVRKLGLVSLVFGIDVRLKPQSRQAQLAWLVLDAACQAVFGHYDNRATRARVPASDRVELAPPAERRREGVLINLDHRGAPETEEGRIRLLKQDQAARRAHRNPHDDYTVVTLPDFWRTRVYVLVASMLLSGAALTVAIFFVPLAIGRQVTAMVLDPPVYDGYSWIIGVYLCLISYSLGQSAKKHIIDASRAERLRRSKKSTRVKRWVLGTVRGVYATIMLYLFLPMLVGINFELFISLPVRYGFSSDVTPVLHVWDAWAAGAALLSLYVGVLGIAGEEGHRLRGTSFREMFRRPLHQSFSDITSLCMPLFGYLVIPIIAPWLAFVTLRSSLIMLGVPLPQVDNTWAFRMMYPITSTGILAYASWRSISATIHSIRQWMIDAEYVVEERVENYNPGPDEADDTVAVVPITAAEVDPAAIAEVQVEIEEDVDEGEEQWEDVEDIGRRLRAEAAQARAEAALARAEAVQARLDAMAAAARQPEAVTDSTSPAETPVQVNKHAVDTNVPAFAGTVQINSSPSTAANGAVNDRQADATHDANGQDNAAH